MAFNINQFKSELVGGGARPTLFQCQITNPINPAADIKVPFMVRAGGIPESVVGQYTVPYFGRQVKYAGDRTFADWTTTVLNDQNQKIREALEDLQRLYAPTNYNSSEGKTRSGTSEEDFNTITIEQLDNAGQNATYVYSLKNCWPSDISTIDLSYDSTDTIEEFTVTWSYDYFVFGDTIADVT